MEWVVRHRGRSELLLGGLRRGSGDQSLESPVSFCGDAPGTVKAGYVGRLEDGVFLCCVRDAACWVCDSATEWSRPCQFHNESVHFQLEAARGSQSCLGT